MSPPATTICFLGKTFLRPPPPILRGVELFYRTFLVEMAEMGLSIDVPVTRDWPPHLTAVHEAGGRLRPLHGPGSSGLFSPGFAARDAYDLCFLGNVGKGLIPAVRWLAWRKRFRRLLVLANREASPGFVRMCADLSATVVTVNRKIAEPFEAAGCGRVAVYYGVTDPGSFLAAERDPPALGVRPIRFGLLGALDNPWKGADTALAAFRRLPPAVRTGCELHLCAYLEPPRIEDPGVVLHPWRPAEEIPQFLQEMDVLLVPSRDEHVMRETFCQAMVQGMLSGLPIVAHDLPILAEKLDTGGGLLFRDEAGCTEAMRRLAEDPTLRRVLGREARSVARERYIWDTSHFVEQFL